MAVLSPENVKLLEKEVAASQEFEPPDVMVGQEVLWYAHKGQDAKLAFVTKHHNKGISVNVVSVDGADMYRQFKAFVRHKDDPQAHRNPEGCWEHTPDRKALGVILGHMKERLEWQEAQAEKIAALERRTLSLENLMGGA